MCIRDSAKARFGSASLWSEGCPAVARRGEGGPHPSPIAHLCAGWHGWLGPEAAHGDGGGAAGELRRGDGGGALGEGGGERPVEGVARRRAVDHDRGRGGN